MTKLDENKIIDLFQIKLGNKKFVSEDVEIFTLGKTKIIAKTDTMVQSTDIPQKMKLSDAARKSVITLFHVLYILYLFYVLHDLHVLYELHVLNVLNILHMLPMLYVLYVYMLHIIDTFPVLHVLNVLHVLYSL